MADDTTAFRTCGPMKRQLPKPHHLALSMKVKRSELSLKARRPEKALTIDEPCAIAKRPWRATAPPDMILALLDGL